MKRTLLAGLLASVLLCACGEPAFPDFPGVPGVTLYPEDLEAMLPDILDQWDSQELTLLIDDEMDEVIVQAAQTFSDKLAELSGGQLAVTVRQQAGSATTFAAGNSQFAFLDSQRDRHICYPFDAVSLGFLYPDYTTFTMAANDQRTLDMLTGDMSNRIGARPLAGFYQPSRHLVTGWQPISYLGFDGVDFVLDDNYDVQLALELLGARVTVVTDVEERRNWMLEGWGMGTELTLAEMAAGDWRNEDIYLTLSYHSLSPLWLAVKEDYYDSLPPALQAAVTESVSYLYQKIDHVYLEEEERLIQQLRAQEVLLNDDFSQPRGRIMSLMESMPNGPVGPEEAFMIGLVGELE